MAREKHAGVKVGIFVSIGILIVIATLFWAKGAAIGDPHREMSVYFSKIDVLNPGDPLNVNGVKKGQVDKVELVADSVRVDFSISESVKIKQDYKIEVAILALMGGNQLALAPGKLPSEVDYKKPLVGTTGSSISAMLEKVGGLTGDVKLLLGEFQKSAEKLNVVMANVNDIVGDPNMKRNLSSTMNNFELASRNLNGLITENRGSLNRITGQVGSTIVNVDSLVVRNSTELNGTIKNIRSLTERVDSLVANLGMIVADTQQQKNGIGKFIYDDKFFENINNTVKELEALMKKIRKDGVKIDLF